MTEKGNRFCTDEQNDKWESPSNDRLKYEHLDNATEASARTNHRSVVSLIHPIPPP